MPTKTTRRQARKTRFHAAIGGAQTAKEAFHEAIRYLTAELADVHNADEAEGARLYAHYARELRDSADEVNGRR